MENDKNQEQEKIVNRQPHQQLLIDIITARQDIDGTFIIDTGKDNPYIPLNWYLGFITNCKGSWQSLGMAFNPSPGRNCMETSIYYIVPKESGFNEQIGDLIKNLKEQIK